MRKATSLAFLLVSCAATVEAAAKVAQESVEFRGRARSYSIFVPPQLEPGETLPLLITFHGSGRDGASLVEKWTGLARKQRILVAGLDSEDRSQWAPYLDPPELLTALIASLSARYPVDPARVYLFGHSSGAIYALRLGLIESEVVAAVAVHAGSFRDAADTDALRKAARKPPVLIVVGDRDPYFSVTSVEATIAALRDAGVPAESFVVRNHDHDYYGAAAAINQRIWEFLSPLRLAGGVESPR